jgi:RNA polymerase sigma-70 factor (ECF subfamily)
MNSRVSSEKELELIAAILAGDTQLYHHLIRPYERSVYTMALSCLKNEEDAEDIAQETFIKAFRNLWTFRGDSRFSTWLISIALNEAKSRLRRQATIRIVSLDEPQSEQMPVSPALLRDWRELPSDLVERKEIRRLLQQAIKMLPDTYQQVFLLRHVEEFNVNDTAQILGISISLVKVRLRRARLMLQKRLAPKLKALSRCVGAEMAPMDIDITGRSF